MGNRNPHSLRQVSITFIMTLIFRASRARRRTVGFSLVELLVVIAIIAVLASMLVPAVSKAKSEGKRIQCQGNLAQLQIAFATYSDEMGHFPSNNYVTEISNEVLVSLSTWAPLTRSSDHTVL